jgi:phosphatidylserine/phosphatidylglycerophosphate/cardiolipin synthase-like enzyme
MTTAAADDARRRRRLGTRLPDPFPSLGGNAVAAYENGPNYFECMVEAIAAATATVDVEMYLWDQDNVGRTFVAALAGAASRGLRVRVLVDAQGSRGVIDALRAVGDAGGDVRVFNPFRLRLLRRYFHRTHKKILVCDGWRAFTGGAGFSRRWTSGRQPEEPYHDWMFEVRGPAAGQLVRVFEADLSRWPRRAPPRERRELDATIDLSAAGTAAVRVLRGWPDARDFRATLIEGIHAAKERVWLGTPYFVPPPSLFRALTKALKRGVDVRLVLPSGNYAHPVLWHASRRHYGWFLRRGATIHEFSHGFYHAKLAVIDRACALVGSSNLDYWSWNRNAEIDLALTDAASVELVAACFDADRTRSRAVTLREIGMRDWLSRFKERTAGWIEDWL